MHIQTLRRMNMSCIINVSLLKSNRDYRFLCIGRFVSLLGSMMTGVALPFQMYQLTHSTIMVGLLSLLQFLPLLITALIGGVCADRYPRRALLMMSESLLALGCCLLIVNTLLIQPHVWVIFILSPLMSAINGLHRPAFDSVTQQLVTGADYKTVAALTSFINAIGLIIGTATAGLILAYHGIAITYLIDGVTFVMSLLCLSFIKKIPMPSTNVSMPIFRSLKQGVRFAFSRQELIGSYSIDFIAMLFAIPTSLFPAMACSFGDVRVLGMLYAAPAVGAIVITFFSGWTSNVKQETKAIAVAAGCWGVAMVGFGLSHSIGLVLFFLVLSGAFNSISSMFRSSLWNNTIPQRFRGRLAGIEMISYLSGPKLGDARAGLMAADFGLSTAVVAGGVLCVLGVVACCYSMPKFWRHHSV